MPPILFVDPQSPYAYLAAARAASVLGEEPELRPVLLGAIFLLRGHGSWSQEPGHERRRAEVEQRAADYGLPPVRWPDGWPRNSVLPARALVWAARQGATAPFAHALFAAQFAEGRPGDDVAVLADAARAAGLDPDVVEAGATSAETKATLREWTDAAWAGGVRGIPTTQVGAELFYGDDQLEAAAAALRRMG